MSPRIYRRNNRRMSAARITIEPIAAPDAEALEHDSPAARGRGRADGRERGDAGGADAGGGQAGQSPLEQPSASLHAGTRRSIDQKPSSATNRNPTA